MSGSLNKVCLIGNLGADPEVRQVGDGIVASLRLATNERYTKRDGTEVDETEWHDLVCWRHLAELAERHLCKGRKIYVEGKLKTRSWADQKTGETKYRTEIVVRELKFLDSRGDGQADTGQGRREPDRGMAETAPAPRQHRRGRREDPPTGAVGPKSNPYRDDDVPF